MESDFDRCDTVQTALVALLDNELSETKKATVRSHLGTCPGCWQQFEALLWTVKTADSWQIQGTDIWQQLESQVMTEQNPGAIRTPPSAPPVKPPTETRSGSELGAVLDEMRALRTDIQQLRGEVGTLRQLLSITRQTPDKARTPAITTANDASCPAGKRQSWTFVRNTTTPCKQH